MKNLLIILFFLSFSALGKAQTASQARENRPKLIVGIVVDQMRWDFLYRYQDRYGEGGFKRMLREGFSCENTFINYVPSITAVGHAAIYTGSVPSINGITGNSWIDIASGRSVYCTEDNTVETVGSSSTAGKMSPRNLLSSTISDELKLASNFRSKVIGVSLKDRASILPAGHAADGAFWFDEKISGFITSSYYMQELPEWVKRFNAQKKPETLIKNGWNTLYPIDTYTNSTADNVIWEDTFAGEEKPVFPHAVDKIYKKDPGVIRTTPFGNTLTLDFAKAAIEGNNLGQGDFTDFLAINCASTDHIGHKFGPNSIEIEDTYLRLDKDLAEFFTYLDSKIGRGEYLVFLSADHGAAHSFDFLAANKIPGSRIDIKKLVDNLNEALSKQFNTDALVISGTNYFIHYDHKKIDDAGLEFDAVKKASINFLKKMDGIQYAIDIERIGEAPVPEPLKTMIINGYNSKRAGPVMIIPEPGWFSGGKKGTSHGTWNPFDTHIPLVFMGWNITAGTSNKIYHISDIAPTISALLNIQMPNGATGRPIVEISDRIVK